MVIYDLVISIHAAREGGDMTFARLYRIKSRFQSTPPVKAATYYTKEQKMEKIFQSTPPVKAATVIAAAFASVLVISIHAAREGGDCGNE